ncbi:hypothetical protein HG361_004189 [Escherichia coli]|nr:hypothetical protein [Escherichia coli]
MKMDERYSSASYGSAGLAAFFASLSLQDWGFIIGVAFSIILGVLTYSAVTGLLVQVARETDDRVTALEEENTTLRENLATAGTRISTLENQVSELVALVRQLTGSEH